MVALGAERRLITIGHSYVVAENRRLAHEMALAGRGRWNVTAIAPESFRGDLRRIALEPIDGEADALVPLRVSWDRSAHFMRYRRLRRVLRSGADVVHCWEEPYVAAAAQVAALKRRRSRLVFASFQNLEKIYPPPLSQFEWLSLWRAAGWIAFGRTVEETLIARRGYGRIPHRVIPPGVDVERFRPDPAAGAAVRREIGWSEHAKVVGFVGRFVPQKGIADLCAALDRMQSGWHALFIGGGELLPDLDRFGARYRGRVHVATAVRHGDVPRWVNAMTVLCAPSRTTSRWREQFGRMLIEAMSCGVPVVATDSGEMPYVLGDAARIVREGDTAALADALDTLLEDPASSAALGSAGVERVRTHFAWPVVARQHLDFFDALLDTRADA
jgi:glycosyltransferase involved in cell wall biosynthesis